jgi:hypothetical protein
MKSTTSFAILFLVGLCFSAWVAGRHWEKSFSARFSPILYCVLFGFGYSALVLDSAIFEALRHSLLSSIVGIAIVFGLWIDSGSTAKRRD